MSSQNTQPPSTDLTVGITGLKHQTCASYVRIHTSPFLIFALFLSCNTLFDRQTSNQQIFAGLGFLNVRICRFFCFNPL